MCYVNTSLVSPLQLFTICLLSSVILFVAELTIICLYIPVTQVDKMVRCNIYPLPVSRNLLLYISSLEKKPSRLQILCRNQKAAKIFSHFKTQPSRIYSPLTFWWPLLFSQILTTYHFRWPSTIFLILTPPTTFVDPLPFYPILTLYHFFRPPPVQFSFYPYHFSNILTPCHFENGIPLHVSNGIALTYISLQCIWIDPPGTSNRPLWINFAEENNYRNYSQFGRISIISL